MLSELETGWWILASISLTRLPAAMKTGSTVGDDTKPIEPSFEYSSREVSPAPLLISQLVQAHSCFLLHHAQGLTELYNRLGRELFSAILDRYWGRFCRDWDVLLHGNPAVDMTNALKLAGGGELGIGVGEEEWGSGEREVLEDFVRRTEGLLDLVVGRFGDAPQSNSKAHEEDDKQVAEKSVTGPWLGVGDAPRAVDGVIFSGTGSIAHGSLATVSQWMDAIFKHGESAYGVGENPSSRPRQRRKREKPGRVGLNKDAGPNHKKTSVEKHPRARSPGNKAPDLRRQAIENAANPTGIPAPLVGNVERSLEQALVNADKKLSPKGSGPDDCKSTTQVQEDESSYFDTETMTRWLKMGYGTSWTLAPKGFTKTAEGETTETPTIEVQSPGLTVLKEPQAEMQQVDPTPELTDEEQDEKPSFVQRLEQSIGKFLVGLSGDLENTEFELDAVDAGLEQSTQPSIEASQTQRIVMRTLTVRLAEPRHSSSRDPSADRSRTPTNASSFGQDSDAPKTSAAASVDGPSANIAFSKLRVAVYVHQPFIFVFLFDLQTPNLTIPGFYRSLHHQLGPLQKPLLRSTDPLRISERMGQLMGDRHNSNVSMHGLYDLVYDPVKLTVRTSVPNIPIPGTLAAEGLTNSTSKSAISGSWYTLGIPISSHSDIVAPASGVSTAGLAQSDWTRLDALNVHTQLLGTWISARKSGDIERTVKTNRGWWIVWLRMPATPSSDASPTTSSVQRSRRNIWDASGHREAFLVRKAIDPAAKVASSRSTNISGKWLLREQRDVSGRSDASSQTAGATSARGVVEGVGVDVRRWVEAVGRLSQ